MDIEYQIIHLDDLNNLIDDKIILDVDPSVYFGEPRFKIGTTRTFDAGNGTYLLLTAPSK